MAVTSRDQAGYGTDGTFHDQQSSLSVVEDHEGTQTNGCADDGQRTPPPWGRQGDRDSGCAAENGGSRHQMQRSNQRVESVPETAPPSSRERPCHSISLAGTSSPNGTWVNP